MTAVRFERRGDRTAVTFTYDPTIVEMLKLIVPSYARAWSKQRREWLIEAVYGKPMRWNGSAPSSSDSTRRRPAVMTTSLHGLDRFSSASDPPGHRWSTGCCRAPVTPITAGITSSSSNSTRHSPKSEGNQHDPAK
jgi:hypothetical protein